MSQSIWKDGIGKGDGGTAPEAEPAERFTCRSSAGWSRIGRQRY